RKNWYSINYDAFNKLLKSRPINAQKAEFPSRQNVTIEGDKMAPSESAKTSLSDGDKMAPSYTESPESPESLTARRLTAGEFNKRLMAYHKARIAGSIP